MPKKIQKLLDIANNEGKFDAYTFLRNEHLDEENVGELCSNKPKEMLSAFRYAVIYHLLTQNCDTSEILTATYKYVKEDFDPLVVADQPARVRVVDAPGAREERDDDDHADAAVADQPARMRLVDAPGAREERDDGGHGDDAREDAFGGGSSSSGSSSSDDDDHAGDSNEDAFGGGSSSGSSSSSDD